jgi:DnaK suppressor protein
MDDQKFIEEQKQKLVRKKDSLTEEINRLKKEDPFLEEQEELGVRVVDDEEDTQELIGHDRMVSKIEELQTSLEQVQKALEAVESGTYGFDEKTGEEIPKERLMVVPEATTKL